MSGGVDSSVAVILLKKEGYDVIGLFMRNWDSNRNNDVLGNPTFNDNICPQEQDYKDALSVCKRIGIPLYRVDFIDEYWDYVFTYFLDELKKGRTPNPDIMCNKFIKFDLFIKEAKKLGADYVATGHYAKVKDGKLYKSLDKNKDQTYFLSQVSNFDNILFPLGDVTKDKVRSIAKEYNLVTANKKDSTGICFIGERNMKEFLSNYLPSQEGDIVNIETKEVMGKHHGLMYYTIGQRKGLNIGTTDKLFVVGKDLANNRLLVALNENNEYLYSDSAIISEMNFISNIRPTKCMAKFRYRQPDQEVNVEYLDNNEIRVSYNNLKAITPGQACVLYLDDECLGGGIIKEIYKEGKRIPYL